MVLSCSFVMWWLMCVVYKLEALKTTITVTRVHIKKGGGGVNRRERRRGVELGRIEGGAPKLK